MTKVLFNRTLAKTVALSENRSGSMGATRDTWVIKGKKDVQLSTTVASNYAYHETTYGDPIFNKRTLKAAPVGSVLRNEYSSNWSGQEPYYTVKEYVKRADGAWHQTT